ncbi:MAG: diacylglycerol kinase family lipid kinase [Fimbriimonadaceae bacterium]|nr:diacylglycerol kinase family lipid kinase [Fimbriimonadaceae bacterium]
MPLPGPVAFIVNPHAGRRQKHVAWIEREAQAGDRLLITQARGEAEGLARTAIAEGARTIAVWGGDGTANEALPALAGTDAVLAVLPGGTGNDLARHLQTPLEAARAWEALNGGEPRTVDLGRLNDRPFINIVSCGFDAAVGERINRPGRRSGGTFAYIVALVQTLAAFQPLPLKISSEDKPVWEGEAMLCAIANASSYGGGMKVSPQSRLDDGLLDLVILEKIGRGELLRQFPKVFSGSHLSHPKVHHIRLRSGRLVTGRPTPLLVDGEPGPALPVSFEIRPSAIRLAHP